MIRPIIQRDEPVRFYWARTLKWNGALHLGQVIDQQIDGKQYKLTTNTMLRPVLYEDIAKVAGLELEELFRYHTMQHYHRPTVGPIDIESISSEEGGLHTRNRRLYFCDECVENDIVKRGFSYWRRVHQIPGMWWCLIHHAPLSKIFCAGSWEKLNSPAYYYNLHKSYSKWPADIELCGPILRALQIKKHILDMRIPFDARAVRAIILSRLLDLRVNLNMMYDAMPISGFVKENYDHRWLLEAHKSAISDRTNKIDGTLDRLRFTEHQMSAGDIALLYGLAWETTNSALDALYKTDIDELKRRRPSCYY